MTRFIGKVGKMLDHCGFIALGTVTREDGSDHDLDTEMDIFVHQDDAPDTVLKIDLDLNFEVTIENAKRAGQLRAVKVRESKAAVMAGNVAIPGFLVPHRGIHGLPMVGGVPLHRLMKDVPQETVDGVKDSKPFDDVHKAQDNSPKTAHEQAELLQMYLSTLFPALASFGSDFRVMNHTDEDLDRLAAEATATQAELGMTDQITVLQDTIARFKSVRAMLRFVLDEGLIRPDSILPMKYLPDLFLAAPVWFYAKQEADLYNRVRLDFSGNDGEDLPMDEPSMFKTETDTLSLPSRYFCGLMDNTRWQQLFQIFNREPRPLSRYKGDVIPPPLLARIKGAQAHFDYVVVATPYLDLVQAEWDTWTRSVDPYILGFKKGIGYFFVLGRFSDAGTFPLHDELVGDTVEFLRANKKSFGDLLPSGYIPWYKDDLQLVGNGAMINLDLDRLVNQLLIAFENKRLFEWFRDPKVKATEFVEEPDAPQPKPKKGFFARMFGR